jgi:hypothetical protein
MAGITGRLCGPLHRLGRRDPAQPAVRGRWTGPAAARAQATGALAGRLRRDRRLFQRRAAEIARRCLHRGGAPPLAGAASLPDTATFCAHRPSQQCAMPDPLHSAQVTSKNWPLTEMGKAVPKGIGGPAEMGLSASIRPNPWRISHRICPLRIESAIVAAQYRFGNVFDQKSQGKCPQPLREQWAAAEPAQQRRINWCNSAQCRKISQF